MWRQWSWALLIFPFPLSLFSSQSLLYNKLSQFLEHLANNFCALIIYIFEQTLNTGGNYAFRDLVVYEELYEQFHVAKQLQTLAKLNFLLVEHEEHLTVEVTLYIHIIATIFTMFNIFLCTFLLFLCHTSFSTPLIFFFLLLHLKELLLALVKQQFFEIHFFIFFIVVLSEQQDA